MPSPQWKRPCSVHLGISDHPVYHACLLPGMGLILVVLNSNHHIEWVSLLTQSVSEEEKKNLVFLKDG